MNRFNQVNSKPGALQYVADLIFGDLSLLASLCLAHFIVWRTIRAERIERLAPVRGE